VVPTVVPGRGGDDDSGGGGRGGAGKVPMAVKDGRTVRVSGAIPGHRHGGARGGRGGGCALESDAE
jgi:hypothetical protein